MAPDMIEFFRQSQGGGQVFVAGVAASQFLPASNQRVGLVLGSHISNRLTFSDLSSVLAGIGLNMPGNSLPLFLDLFSLGGLIQRPWFVIASAAGSSFYFCEIFNPNL